MGIGGDFDGTPVTPAGLTTSPATPPCSPNSAPPLVRADLQALAGANTLRALRSATLTTPATPVTRS